MVQIENLIEKTPSFKQITADLQPKNHQLITGISGSARTELLSALSKEGRRPILVVTDTISHMQELASDLENLLPANRVYQFPVEEVLAAEVATSSPQHHSTAPGPPSDIAVATPMMLPVPIVAANDVARAANWLTSPDVSLSLFTLSFIAVNILR